MKYYKELILNLESLISNFKFSAEINLKLERIQYLLELLGNPHKNFKTIHVGGTSGKGTISVLIAKILEKHNL